tara:strand:- start:159 stop:671 length:513 start_codon:yes stop_codon:yes gene_type:complete
MSAMPPINYTWDGEALRPLHPKLADKHLVIGERYTLVEHQARSQSSHNHYFAALNEGWQNLPEHLAERFATAEHLRAFALIKAGYHDSHSITCASKAEALRVAAFVRPTDEFSIVTVNEATVTRYVAQSQSMRAMGKQKFQESKSAVLEIVSAMVGVQPEDLRREATRAA